MTGAELIAKERERQIKTEGWSAQHDDKHDGGALVAAAVTYALEATFDGPAVKGKWFKQFWMFEDKWFKPKNKMRDLARAGALLAAEIDRLQRFAGVNPRMEDFGKPAKEYKIAIPPGMKKVADEAFMEWNMRNPATKSMTDYILEGAIKWLIENPIEPDDKLFGQLIVDASKRLGEEEWSSSMEWTRTKLLIAEFQRHLFFEPIIEIPDAVRDLMMWTLDTVPSEKQLADMRGLIVEAYHRGLQGSK